jgi:hypothetical protein
MEKIEKKETVYTCKFKTKNVRQVITFSHDKVPFNFNLELTGCVTDIDDLKIFYQFLGELLAEY